MELPAPWPGVIRELAVRVGDKVAEGSRICSIEVEESLSASTPGLSREAVRSAAAPASAPAPTDVSHDPAQDEPLPPALAPLASAGGQRASAAARELVRDEPVAVQSAAPAKLAHAGPSVRRFAHDLGVDLRRVEGSGRKGRIQKEDVQRYVKRALSAPAPGAPAAGALQIPAAPKIDFAKYGPIEIQPLNRIRKVSARNLHRSWLTIPHVTQFDEADITDLEDFRRSRLEEARAKGVKLTLTVLLLKALEVALQDFPMFRASLDEMGENLIVKKYTHLGVAVDTEHGLVVPVVKNVDRKSLLGIAAELADLSERARNRKLSPEDLSGACMTISSLGGIGGTAFTPIVNHPEVAILGVSRSQIEPVWRDGQFVPRLLLPLSLSYDHRAIDGADAVRFTTRLVAVLADIRNLIL
jgi:pyruvate dehydrogenase E2 component (dihydrolipoamide acetyltransferase)